MFRDAPPPDGLRYRARIDQDWLVVTHPSPSLACVVLPHSTNIVPSEGGLEHLRIVLEDGVAYGPLVVHVDDWGYEFRLIRLERPANRDEQVVTAVSR